MRQLAIGTFVTLFRLFLPNTGTTIRHPPGFVLPLLKSAAQTSCNSEEQTRSSCTVLALKIRYGTVPGVKGKFVEQWMVERSGRRGMVWR